MNKKKTKFIESYTDPTNKDSTTYDLELNFVKANLYSNGFYIVSPSSYNMIVDLKTTKIKRDIEKTFINSTIKKIKKDMLLSRNQLLWLDDLITKYLFVN